MQQPGSKHEMGGWAPLDSHWWRPLSVVRFTAAFFGSFIVTVFVSDSAVADIIYPLKMLSEAETWFSGGFDMKVFW